jgi:hypothetical protein
MYTADIWLCMRYYSQVVVRWAESTLIGGRSHHPNLSPAANPTIRGAPVKPPSSPPTSLLFRLVSSRVLQDYRAYTCTTHWRNIIKRWASAFTTESDNLRLFSFLQWKLTDMRRLLWHSLSARRWWKKKSRRIFGIFLEQWAVCLPPFMFLPLWT